MGRGIRLGSIAGIAIRLDWSLLIIFLLISATLALGVFPAWHPDWSAAAHWLTALAAAALFLASVLAHEFSHALVGRARGITVNQITLFIFGGMAEMENEAPNWKSEFWMAVVGPITSLVLGVVFLMLAGLAVGPMPATPADPQAFLAGLGPVPTLLLWLGPVNIILGLFNLVPGFPLDGGRVLRSIMWGITGDLHRATRYASAGGQGFAWLLIGLGVAMMLGFQVPLFGTGFVNGLWLAFIGWFLNNAALVSYRQILVRDVLGDVPVSRLMRAPVETVSPDVSLRSFVDDQLMMSEQRAYPVMEAGRLRGLVSLADVRRCPRESWAQTRVADVMTDAAAVVSVSSRDEAAQALNRLARANVHQLPVIDGGELRGMIQRDDILRWLSLHGGDELSGLGG